MTSSSNVVPVYRTNLSDLTMIWIKVNWTENDQRSSEYIAYESKIYVVGGKRKGSKSARSLHVESYSVTTGDWTEMHHMNVVRFSPALAIFQGLVCVIGGINKISAECLNQTTNAWSYLPPMKTPRARAAAVELHGELYVIGGINNHGNIQDLKSVEKYNPVTRKWMEVAPLSRPRANHAARVVDGRIYVIGKSKLVEAFDPARNIWEVVDNNAKLKTFAWITQ